MADKYIKLSDLQKYPIRLDHYDEKHGNKHFVYGVESVIEYAEFLDPADVVPVIHAKWIDNRFCSHCGGHEENEYGRIVLSGHRDYCSQCGAKMDAGTCENWKES